MTLVNVQFWMNGTSYRMAAQADRSFLELIRKVVTLTEPTGIDPSKVHAVDIETWLHEDYPKLIDEWEGELVN